MKNEEDEEEASKIKNQELWNYGIILTFGTKIHGYDFKITRGTFIIIWWDERKRERIKKERKEKVEVTIKRKMNYG